MADGRAFRLHRELGHRTTLRWPHHFFTRASRSSSVLSGASAYIFFKRHWYNVAELMPWVRQSSGIGGRVRINV